MTMLIEAHDVTAVNLSLDLERAVIQHVLKENESIDVTEDGLYPFWIDMHKSLGSISFNTHTYFKTTCGQIQRLKLCNDFNRNHFMTTAHVVNDEINLDFVVIYWDGLVRETFVRGCRLFARTVENGINQVDHGLYWLLRPGEMKYKVEEGKA